MKTAYHLFFAIILLLLLTSCSSSYLVGSWENPETDRQVNNVYIIGISDKELNRRIFEDTFNNELAKYGVQSVSSYSDLPEDSKNNEDAILERMKDNGTDSVIMTQVIEQRIETVKSSGRISGYASRAPYFPRNGYDNTAYDKRPKYYRNWGSYFNRRAEVTIEPPTTNEFLVLTVESVLYDLKSGEIMWSGQLETVFEGKTEKSVKDYVKLVANDLKAKGLIQSMIN